MKPHVAVITLGVRDLKRARRFYSEGLGWPIQQEDHNWVCFSLGDGSSALALYPWDELAQDADVPADGAGADETHGPLEVRFAAHADTLLERLAAENRDRHHVILVSSDVAVRGTSGQEVQKLSSRTFLGDLDATEHSEERPQRIRDRLDPDTREALERMRRGET